MGNDEINRPSSRLGDISEIDFHSFMMVESSSTYMEIAQALGISIGQVKALKKQMSDT